LAVLKAGVAPDERVAIDSLRAFGGEVYGEADAAAVLHASDPLRIRKKDDTYVLTQELPFADRDDLEVGRRGDELLVRIGPYRRAILLPDSLRRRPVLSAKLRKGKLRVVFGTPDGRTS
jgi:arsenite-transporting ATPase